jgi:hypothetical protein
MRPNPTARLLAQMKQEAGRRAAARVPLLVPAQLLQPDGDEASEAPAVAAANGLWRRLGIDFGMASSEISQPWLVVASINQSAPGAQLQPGLQRGCRLVTLQVRHPGRSGQAQDIDIPNRLSI